MRGYTPDRRLFDWMRDQGMWCHTAGDIEAQANEDPECLYISVDIDVLDPAFAHGIGTPEPDGFTTADLLRAVRRVSLTDRLVDIGVLEVSSPYYGPVVLVLEVAHRVVLEAISAMAWLRFRPQL